MKVPLIETVVPPEFGALQEDPRFVAEAGQNRDYSYVPGFSDLRRQRDREIVELKQGKRKSADVSTLPVNMRWARCQNKKGDPDTRKPISHGTRNYRAVTKADLGQPWFKDMPAGATWQADGTLRNGDTMLMVVDAAGAARNEFQKRLRTETQMRGAEQGFVKALEGAGIATQGAAPTITKEKSSPTRAVFELASK